MSNIHPISPQASFRPSSVSQKIKTPETLALNNNVSEVLNTSTPRAVQAFLGNPVDPGITHELYHYLLGNESASPSTNDLWKNRESTTTGVLSGILSDLPHDNKDYQLCKSTLDYIKQNGLNKDVCFLLAKDVRHLLADHGEAVFNHTMEAALNYCRESWAHTHGRSGSDEEIFKPGINKAISAIKIYVAEITNKTSTASLFAMLTVHKAAIEALGQYIRPPQEVLQTPSEEAQHSVGRSESINRDGQHIINNNNCSSDGNGGRRNTDSRVSGRSRDNLVGLASEVLNSDFSQHEKYKILTRILRVLAGEGSTGDTSSLTSRQSHNHHEYDEQASNTGALKEAEVAGIEIWSNKRVIVAATPERNMKDILSALNDDTRCCILLKRKNPELEDLNVILRCAPGIYGGSTNDFDAELGDLVRVMWAEFQLFKTPNPYATLEQFFERRAAGMPGESSSASTKSNNLAGNASKPDEQASNTGALEEAGELSSVTSIPQPPPVVQEMSYDQQLSDAFSTALNKPIKGNSFLSKVMAFVSNKIWVNNSN